MIRTSLNCSMWDVILVFGRCRQMQIATLYRMPTKLQPRSLVGEVRRYSTDKTHNSRYDRYP